MSCYRITTSVFIYCFLSIVVHQALAQDRSSVVQFDAVTAAELVDPVDEDWLIWRRTYDAQGHSPLDQVNKNNIKDLKEAWRIPLLEGPNMATPLVHDGVMFLASTQDTVLALDAISGKQLWKYEHRPTGFCLLYTSPSPRD